MDVIKCEICNKEFNSQEALAMHNSAKHSKEEKPKKSRKSLFFVIGGVLLVLAVIIGYFLMKGGSAAQPGQYDQFAQYLTDRGVIMYGTEWCAHCKNQKELFGSSFQYINFIDCDKNPQACSAAGVSSYPTWRINGTNYLGEQSIERLIQLSGYQKPSSSSLTGSESNVANAPENSVQKVNLGFRNNYYPNTITVQSGRPVEITLDSSVGGCYRSFNIRALGVSYLSSGPSDTIKFTPDKKGSFRFACGMGMGYGTINVV